MAVRGKKSAKRDPSYRDLKAEYYPVQRQIQLSNTAQTTNSLVDVGRCLSTVNHRLYRQGKTYQVKIDMDNRADGAVGPAQYEIYALMDTWYIQKAWQLARATYLTATAGERGTMSASKVARWEDFRVNGGVTSANEMVPHQYNAALTGSNRTAGEFVTSQIIMTDGTTAKSFTWSLSPSAAEFSILGEYNKSGDTFKSPQDDANTGAGDQAYAGTEDGVNESQMDKLVNDGNHPPYDRANFTSSVWVKIATLDNSVQGNPAGSAGHARMSTGFFNAPCGLIAIKSSLSHNVTGELSLTVKSGDYKGVAAMNMGA